MNMNEPASDCELSRHCVGVINGLADAAHTCSGQWLSNHRFLHELLNVLCVWS